MKVGLDGRIILVTGAANGIGAAIAQAALEAGAAGLFLTDRAEMPAPLPDHVATFRADLEEDDAAARIIAAAAERFGRIDGLVNAAGLTTRGGFLDTDPALWDRLMRVNARAPFFLMGGAIADMTARGAPGAIVNIQSMNAHCGAPDLAAYAATKGALQTMTRNAANAHLPDRIRVNGINLGWVATDTERDLHEVTLGKPPGWLEAQGKEKPLGRLLHPAEAARLAVYLLSDASAPMTGVSMDLEQAVVGAPG